MGMQRMTPLITWKTRWNSPLTNSWIIIVIWLYLALNRTPNIDCYLAGSTQYVGFLALGFRDVNRDAHCLGWESTRPAPKLSNPKLYRVWGLGFGV